MRRVTCRLSLAILAGLLLLGKLGAAEPLQVFVSIGPQKFLVERVAGNHVQAGVLVGPGQNHHTFEPTPRQLADLSSAKAYFTIGLPFEKRLVEKAQAANAGLAVVDTREGISLRKMEEADPDEAPGHDHGAFDPHVWLSPVNAQIIAGNMCKALKAADPEHSAEYDRNLAVLDQDLDASNQRIADLLAPCRGTTFYVYHPAFGYFADAYGLKQASVEIEGKEPTAKQLADLIAKSKADRVRVIFVQQQFPRKSAETIAQEIGGAVIPIDPLSADYLTNLEDIARKIRAACEGR